MAEAGWYDDPMIPGGKRYWDGVQWTEHAHPPQTGPAAAGPPEAEAAPGIGGSDAGSQGPPPFGASVIAGSAPSYHHGSINAIGDWIGRSFRMVFQQLGSLTIFFILQFVFYAAAYMLLHQALIDVGIARGGEVFGADRGLLAAAGVSLFLATLAGAVTLLATHHNLYGAHVGRPPSWGQSLSAGFARLLRYIGIVIAIYLVMVLTIGVAAAVIFGIGTAFGADSGIVVALSILLYIALVALLFWMSIKLTFITVATVVVPAETSAIKAAWDSSTGFFWPILGRLLLLSLILSLIILLPMLLFAFVLSVLFFTKFQILSDGTVTLNGESLENLSFFEFSDVLPNPTTVIVLLAVATFVITMIQSVSYSGAAALYADVGGPNSFGHSRR